MTSSRPAKRTATTAPGVKLLITAASFAATIGGWALIGAEEDTTAQTVGAPDVATNVAPVVVPPQQTTELIIRLEPLPTLVPQPTPQSQSVATSNRPAAAARPVNPQPAAAPAPALRVVTAPGSGGGGGGAAAPVATTRSSQ